MGTTDTPILITNIVLAALTALYVILTYRLVRHSKKANEINLKATTEQLRVLTSPYIHCEIRREKDELFIILTNGGSAPAYDVEVWASGFYYYGEISSYPGVVLLNNAAQIGSDEEVRIRNRMTYPVFFHKKQVTARLEFPIITDSVTVFIQYRDSRADNYSYRLWFIDDTEGSRKSYQLADIKPAGNITSPRVDFIRIEDKDGLDKSMPSHIVEFYNQGFKSGLGFKKMHQDSVTEDRGEWKDL